MMQNRQQKLRAVRATVEFGSVCALALVVCAILDRGALEPRVMAASTPSFSADVAPILQKNCLACHSSSIHRSGLILESYSGLMKGGRHGQPILPHDAKGSRIIQMLEGDVDPQMPAEAAPLPASDIEVIKAWINAGAEGPVASEAMPPMVTLSIPAGRRSSTGKSGSGTFSRISS